MSKPYLQRRGDTYTFRISVPSDLRPFLGFREFTRTLRTHDRHVAAPRALYLASQLLQLFTRLRAMPKKQREGLSIGYIMKIDFDELGYTKRIEAEGEPHEHEAINSTIKGIRATDQMRRSVADSFTEDRDSSISTVKNASGDLKADSVPMFETVIHGFLKSYQRDKKQDMFRKHQTVLPMFLGIVGNKPINELKQADINGFFELLEKLPPRWPDECRKRKLTIKELAELEHPITLGPKTIEDTYKACIRAFLKAAIRDWQDQGLPATLTTDGVEYKGNREEGENKQRGFTRKELERLFKGPEMKAFAINPDEAHCYWLPLIGLFTGARVNEICQLNPQTDILKDLETGIWHFSITGETEGDSRIRKRTKNKISTRKVPVHSTLQCLGFLCYAEQVKREGAKLLFPAWKPMRGKASAEAEKWFRQFLTDIGLREKISGANLVGMHAFRHTLLNRASNATPPISAESITGHAGETSVIVRGYAGELSLENKKRILEAIPFGLDLNTA